MFQIRRTTNVLEIELDDATNSAVLTISDSEVVPTRDLATSSPRELDENFQLYSGQNAFDPTAHEETLICSSYVIHISKDERWTFVGVDQMIILNLIDCREDSETVGVEVRVKMKVSPERIVVIPRGVAHAFEGLTGVVSSNEATWFSGETPDWNSDTDLISFPRSSVKHPAVTVCDHPLPQEDPYSGCQRVCPDFD